jgi:hypothetical protein
LEARRAVDQAAAVADAFIEQLLAEHPSDLASFLRTQRQQLFDMEDYETTVNVGERLLEVLKQIAIRDPAGSALQLSEALIAHAVAVRNLGDKRQSADLCVQAAEVVDFRLSPEHAALKANALSNAATTLLAMHEIATAVEYANSSVRILRDSTRETHPRYQLGLAYALNQLGVVLSEAAETSRALDASKESVAIYRSIMPFTRDDHWLMFAQALRNLGADLMTARQFARAADVTREAIAILESIKYFRPIGVRSELVGTLKNLEHQLRTLRQYQEHYSKLPRWSAFRAEYNVLRNFMTRRMRYLKSNGSPERFESSDQRILKPGRAVALLSYHRPDAHADAGTRPPRERGA